MITVGATNSGEAFLQIATLEKCCDGLFDDRPPIAVLGLKAFIVNLLEGVKVLVDQAPQIRRFRITWLVEGRQFGTGQSHEQHATSPTGGRASQSRQPILGSLTDCVVCNRRKVMMYACSLTVNAGQPLMAAQRWDHESYVARFTGKSCGPVWKTCQQWLVEDCLEVAKVYVWPKNSVAATWTLSNRPSDSGAHNDRNSNLYKGPHTPMHVMNSPPSLYPDRCPECRKFFRTTGFYGD